MATGTIASRSRKVTIPSQARIFDARLASHSRYDNCVRANALELAARDAGPDILARASVALCHMEELALWLAGLRQCASIDEDSEDVGRDRACADRFMDRWVLHAEREALGCIAAKRYKPAALAEICRMTVEAGTEEE